MKTTQTSFAIRLGMLTLIPVIGLAGSVQAQTTKKKNIIQRHPTASAVVAGVAAHHYAKKHSSGLLHRHPTATGVAAAAAVHHYAKKKK